MLDLVRLSSKPECSICKLNFVGLGYEICVFVEYTL